MYPGTSSAQNGTPRAVGRYLSRRFLPGDPRTIAMVAAALAAFHLAAVWMLQASGHPVAEMPLSWGRAFLSIVFSALFVVGLAAVQTQRGRVTPSSAVWAWLVSMSGVSAVYFDDSNATRAVVMVLGSAGASLWLFVRRRTAAG